jgi:hypothetical protein
MTVAHVSGRMTVAHVSGRMTVPGVDRSVPVADVSRSVPVAGARSGSRLLLVAASLLLQAGALCLLQVAPFLAQLSRPPVGPHRVLRAARGARTLSRFRQLLSVTNGTRRAQAVTQA